jgi:hypothetical protein
VEFAEMNEVRTAKTSRSVLSVTPTACGGTSNGVTMLSEEGAALIFDVQYEGLDLNLGSPQKFGMGFGLLPGPGS